MKTLLLSAGIGFAVTVGAYAVVADSSFWSPSVEARSTEKAGTISLVGEPGLQNGTDKITTHQEVEKRAVQSSDVSVILRESSEGISEGSKTPKAKLHAKKHASAVTTVSSHAEGAFSVQVGSFKTENEANSRLETLQKKGFSGFVRQAEVNGTPYFRVRLGPVEDKESAKGLKAKAIETAGIKEAFVARD